jgi:hypothetical protein
MSETGKIYEYSDTFMILNVYNPKKEGGYTLKVGPTTVPGIIRITWRNQSYSATIEQAKEHIRLALKIAGGSQYSTPHNVRFFCPFYPNVVVPVEKVNTIMELVDQILANYA